MNLIFMIDSTLQNPLFLRDRTGKIMSNILNVNWYAEENRTFTVSKDFFSKINKDNYQTSKQLASKLKPSYEVKMMDYNQFENLFWNKQKKKYFKDKMDVSRFFTIFSLTRS